MKYLVYTACLILMLSHTNTSLADNKISEIFRALFSIEGSCKACIDSDECYKIEQTCQRNCILSLLSSEEKTTACKNDCTSSWSSCLTAAKSNCKDYCPPE